MTPLPVVQEPHACTTRLRKRREVISGDELAASSMDKCKEMNKYPKLRSGPVVATLCVSDLIAGM